MAQLPEELLQHICSYLRIECSQKSVAEDRLRLATLLNISLASKACNRSAAVHLYSTLDLRGNAFHRLRPFLATLAKRSSLCAAVQRVHNDSFETQRDLDSGNTETEAPSVDVAAQMTGLADTITNGDLRDTIKNSLSKGLQDAELALLLCICTNLRFWKTDAVNRMDQTLCMTVIRAAAGSDPDPGSRPLQHLSEVNVTHWDTEGAVRMPKIQDFLDLPLLGTLRARMVRCDQANQITNPGPSALKRVYLDDCVVDGPGLQSLLVICPHLETLSIRWGSSIVGVCDVDYDSLGAALRQHATSLRNLTLHTGDTGITSPPHVSLGSLTELQSLRMLSIPEDLLLNENLIDPLDDGWLAQRLPSSLRTLRITGADDDSATTLDKQITRVVSESQFADLTKIKINRREEFTMDISDIGWDESETTKFWVILTKVA